MSNPPSVANSAPPTSLGVRLILLVAALAGLVIAWAILRQRVGTDDGMGTSHPAVGQKLESLKLEPLTGTETPLVLADLDAKVALINVWGTWCRPCLVEFPHLRDLAEHFKSQADFRFVSISCPPPGADDRDLAENTAALLKEKQADFATYADPRGETRQEIARAVGESKGIPYPTTLILGRDGTIRAVWFGYRDGLTDAMRDVINDALRDGAGG